MDAMWRRCFGMPRRLPQAAPAEVIVAAASVIGECQQRIDDLSMKREAYRAAAIDATRRQARDLGKVQLAYAKALDQQILSLLQRKINLDSAVGQLDSAEFNASAVATIRQVLAALEQQTLTVDHVAEVQASLETLAREQDEVAQELARPVTTGSTPLYTDADLEDELDALLLPQQAEGAAAAAQQRDAALVLLEEDDAVIVTIPPRQQTAIASMI